MPENFVSGMVAKRNADLKTANQMWLSGTFVDYMALSRTRSYAPTLAVTNKRMLDENVYGMVEASSAE